MLLKLYYGARHRGNSLPLWTTLRLRLLPFISPLSTFSSRPCQAAHLNPTRGFGEGTGAVLQTMAKISWCSLPSPFPSYPLLFPISLPSHTLPFPSKASLPFSSFPFSPLFSLSFMDTLIALTYLLPPNLSSGVWRSGVYCVSNES